VPLQTNSQAHYTKGTPLSLNSETVCQSLRFTEARTVSLSVYLSFAVLVHYRSQTLEDRLEQDRPIFMPTFTYLTLLISLRISQYTGLVSPFLVFAILSVIFFVTTVVQIRSPLLLNSRLINLLELLRCFTSLLFIFIVGFPSRVSVALWEFPTTAYRIVKRPYFIRLCLRYPRKTLVYYGQRGSNP
jgi:hypothetical protein